jgi:hypothetical protein
VQLGSASSVRPSVRQSQPGSQSPTPNRSSNLSAESINSAASPASSREIHPNRTGRQGKGRSRAGEHQSTTACNLQPPFPHEEETCNRQAEAKPALPSASAATRMAAPHPSSSARARAPPRPLHPLAGLEDGEAVAAAHPGAHRMRRKGRKQKQVRDGSFLISRYYPDSEQCLVSFILTCSARASSGADVPVLS